MKRAYLFVVKNQILCFFAEPSFGVESDDVSDDYAIPPDAFASETSSLDLALSSGCRNMVGPGVGLGSSGPPGTTLAVSLGPSSGSSNGGGIINSLEGSPRKESLEKTGYLTKLGGKLKTWRKRYFVLKNGNLTYWKTQVGFIYKIGLLIKFISVGGVDELSFVDITTCVFRKREDYLILQELRVSES